VLGRRILTATSPFGIPLLRQASGYSFDVGQEQEQGCEGRGGRTRLVDLARCPLDTTIFVTYDSR
jgi:hypothetical protein